MCVCGGGGGGGGFTGVRNRGEFLSVCIKVSVKQE